MGEYVHPTLERIAPLITEKTSMGEVPKLWVRYIEHKIIRTPEGCWLWTGALGNNGFGIIKQKHGEKKGVNMNVVRWAAKLFWDIPYDYAMGHTCGNKLCLNPYHWVIYKRGERPAEKKHY